MLARYRIVRGARPADDPLPEGIRQDTRKHTRHVLRPAPELVQALLDDPSEASFQAFRRGYLQLLEQRFAREPERFDALAELARTQNVYIGCNCPSARQPHVQRCHTTLALGFLQGRYPDLAIQIPEARAQGQRRSNLAQNT